MNGARHVYRLGMHSPVPRSVVDVAAIPVIDDPLPVPPGSRPRFQRPGCGPWQRKAMAMRVGQSIVVTAEQADSFRGACRRLGIQVARCRLDSGLVQVQVISKPSRADDAHMEPST